MFTSGTKVAHYRIEKKLGAGGMGDVYLAEDTKLQRKVALKFLPSEYSSEPELKTRFTREAQAAAALSHPNIVTVFEISEHEGQLYIAMEYVAGKSLKDLIARKKLSFGEVLEIALQISEGLTVAHGAGIIHRDVKPQNILIGKDGRVRICDFGLAKLKRDVTLTQAGSTLGTVAYMSPEQAQGKEADHRSDIFSFGVVLYEMITSGLPFKGEHEAAMIHAIVNDPPEPLARYKADVPEGLQRIVDKALAKDKSERYQHADDLLADLKREKRSLEQSKTVEVPSETTEARQKKKLLPFVIPASIIFMVVVLLLILKPFQIQIAPEKAAVAEENSLAIMYFENMVDKKDTERLGEIVTNLLITDLSESQYLNVVSSQRLYDILKLLGREGEKVIDRSVATEVATKARAKWMLLGNILQVEPEIILTSQLVDVKSGKVAASERVDGETGENIFSMVDRLTVEVKSDLSLPAAAQSEPDRPVAEVTTHSPEAYRFYLEGVDYGWKFYFADAAKSLEKAIELDSTFVMAYYRLAGVRRSEARSLLAKAMTYANKVSWKERQYVKGAYAFHSGDYIKAIEELQSIIQRYPDEKEAFWTIGYIYGQILQQPEEGIRHLNKAIEIDPLYKIAYNQLAYAYDEIGNFDKSIWAINKYISLAPDEANPYDSRGDLYAYNGKLEQAIESYRKASEMKPGYSTEKLGHMYLFNRQYAKAESCYKALASSSGKDTRSLGRTELAYVPLYQGKFEEALEVLDDGIAADRMEGTEKRQNAYKHFLKATIYLEEKNPSLALSEVEICVDILKEAAPGSPVEMRDLYTYILVESGKITEAEEVARALKKDIEEKNPTLMYAYWLASGAIEWAKGNTETAITYVEKACKEAPSPFFYIQFHLARVYLESGRLGEAVTEFEKVLSRYDSWRALSTIWAVKAHYLLGLAYEKSGWSKKAIQQYEQFLDIWKDADPGIPEVEDAKQRLKVLKAQS
jgi:serine/threonine protein kinase/Tfp pilus assembly protein PilF